MEYCELGDLKDHIEEHGKLAEDQVQDIGWQILQGLRFMHNNDFAHRDLKPANILIKSKPPYGDWHVKICDLGLSKRIGTDADTTTAQGTPGFMPPELVPSIGDNPRLIDPVPADMWCLGETIFYLLTSKRTFGGDLIQLQRYWKGKPFPKEPLLHVRASDVAIGFVQELMAPLPAQRLTAEMADQHELMKPEPFQEVDQETRETPEGKEDSSTMIPEDPASGRWTTGTSHQQSMGVPSGSQSSKIVEEVLPAQIPRSHRNNDTGPPSSVQGPERGTNTLTQKDGDEILLSDQSKLEVQARSEVPVAVHREATGYEPQDALGSSSGPEPRPSNMRDRFGFVIEGPKGINLSSHEPRRPSSAPGERVFSETVPGYGRVMGKQPAPRLTRRATMPARMPARMPSDIPRRTKPTTPTIMAPRLTRRATMPARMPSDMPRRTKPRRRPLPATMPQPTTSTIMGRRAWIAQTQPPLQPRAITLMRMPPQAGRPRTQRPLWPRAPTPPATRRRAEIKRDKRKPGITSRIMSLFRKQPAIVGDEVDNH
ncbi:hypothetical protein FALCPG4_010456 [Fusarium falciforme]